MGYVAKHGHVCRVAQAVTKDERLSLKAAPKLAETFQIAFQGHTAALLKLALSPGSQTPREGKWRNALKALTITSFSAPKILHP